MSYTTIDISEVGPAEYPLIAVLRDTIFAEHKHVYRTSFEDMVRDRQDLICLIAHLEGNPVGYKVGYRDRPKGYYSYSGGVLKDYRGEGIARRMQAMQHGMIKARGYTSVYYNSFNKFRNMLLLGLDTGFVPVGIETRPEGEISIKLTKDLTQPDPLPQAKRPAADVHVESVGPNFHGLIADLATRTFEPTTESDIDKEMGSQDALALVAYIDGQPVGFKIGNSRDPRRRAYLSRLGGVLPEARGRGVALALLKHQLQFAASNGYAAARWHIRHDNAPLISMALKIGFDVNGMTFHARRKIALVVLERAITPS
jgi:GNAT superfamily N-acetyltransferase